MQVAILLQPLCGSLRADTWHADQVVASFANQGGQVWVLLGMHAVLLKDGCVVHAGQVQNSLDWVENGRVLTNELESVTVSAHDKDAVARCGGLICHRGNEVIRFVIFAGESDYVHRGKRFAQKLGLAIELRRCFASSALVFRVFERAE